MEMPVVPSLFWGWIRARRLRGLTPFAWLVLLSFLFQSPSSLGAPSAEPAPKTIVRITADPAVTSEPLPDVFILPGQFIIRRDGDLSRPLGVEIAYSGTAKAIEDYLPLREKIEFGAGKSETTLLVVARNDTKIEGDETVIATLTAVRSPGPNSPKAEIDPDHASATIILRDANQPANATLTLASPSSGDRFEAGETVVIRAVAVDPQGHIPRVEFFVDGQSIGVSELEFFTNPAPGTPIHHTFEWIADGPGKRALSARGDSSAGKAVTSPEVVIQIRDPNPGKPPDVFISNPRHGAVLEGGETIQVRVEAKDADQDLVAIEVFSGDDLLGSADSSPLVVEWRPDPGLHRLRARAFDAKGHEGNSGMVLVYVRDPLRRAFVWRALPPAYLPQVPVDVRLVARPQNGAGSWAVEERVPSGWSLLEASEDGVLDPARDALKFGPFTDDAERVLRYSLMPPADAEGPREFDGDASLDGVSRPIAGDTTLPQANEFHPADAQPADGAVTMDEVSAYAAAWKMGLPWGRDQLPIPLSYVTRAGYLWKTGESYSFVPDQSPPECWIPAEPSKERATAAVPAGQPWGARNAPTLWKPGHAHGVEVQVTPAPGTRVFAVEEVVPEDWQVSDISDDGHFDPASRRIRWGLMTGDASRTFTYRAAPPADKACIALFEGHASFDGLNVATTGTARAGATDSATAMRILGSRRVGPNAIRLQLTAPPEQVCVIEASSDLRAWSEIGAIVFTGEEIEVVDPALADDSVRQRFYRLRPVRD